MYSGDGSDDEDYTTDPEPYDYVIDPPFLTKQYHDPNITIGKFNFNFLIRCLCYTVVTQSNENILSFPESAKLIICRITSYQGSFHRLQQEMVY